MKLQITNRNKISIIRLCVPFLVLTVAVTFEATAGQKSKADTELEKLISNRAQQGQELFKALGKKRGRVIVMLPKPGQDVQKLGKTIKGRPGLLLMRKSKLDSILEFEEGSPVGIYERGEKGTVTSRIALVGSVLGVTMVVDEKSGKNVWRDIAKAKKTAPKPPTAKAGQSSAEEQAVTEPESMSTVEMLRGLYQDGDAVIVIDSSDSSASQETQSLMDYRQDVDTQTEWVEVEVAGSGCSDDLSGTKGDIYGGQLLGSSSCHDGRKARKGEVWVGTAPICEATTKSCNEIGMEWVAFDTYGEGAECLSGQKALCRPLEEGETIQVWLGTAPFCAATKDSCTEIGLSYVKSSSKGDGEECLSGEKVLCETQSASAEDEKIQTWIGTAPFCEASKSSCTDRNMNYVKSDKKGDGEECWTGTKVLCESK